MLKLSKNNALANVTLCLIGQRQEFATANYVIRGLSFKYVDFPYNSGISVTYN